jgi:hypothetical protein
MDADHDAPREILGEFLAGRNEPCPACGYNLRDVSSGQCPECGRPLTLGLRVPGALWRRRGMLALVLLWLLVAGSMNATRAGRSIYSIVNSSQWITYRTAVPGGVSSFTVNPVAPRPPAPGAPPPTAVTLPGLEEVQIDLGPADGTTPGAVRIQGTTIGSGPTPVFVSPAPVPTGTRRWSLVPAVRWVDLAWWTALAAGATAALVVLVVRRHTATPRVSRGLVTYAWVGFAGYFAYHLWRFVGEWI